MPEKRACAKSGCKSPPLHDDTFCFSHSEKTREAHLLAAAKGGVSAHKAMSVLEAQKMLARIARKVIAGKMLARDAAAATCALRAVIHAAEIAELERTNDLIERKTDNAQQSQ